ncbi:MAG: MarR family winged helix-turn-helix transcriptional regulator [Pseudomonadota bacterium]|nr:MarR family winged helix-turn-helix transcriptional regulator [Pseudomonadota bacterium]
MALKNVNEVDVKRAQELSTAIELVHFGFRAMIARPDEVLAKRGLTRVHHRILYFVARSPELSVNTLLRTLGVTKQALNRPLRDLCAQGLVRMERSQDDGRVKRLRLTATGARLEARLSSLQQEHFAAAFERAGRDAEAGWRAAMAALASPELIKSGRDLPGGPMLDASPGVLPSR